MLFILSLVKLSMCSSPAFLNPSWEVTAYMSGQLARWISWLNRRDQKGSTWRLVTSGVLQESILVNSPVLSFSMSSSSNTHKRKSAPSYRLQIIPNCEYTCYRQGHSHYSKRPRQAGGKAYRNLKKFNLTNEKRLAPELNQLPAKVWLVLKVNGGF